MKTSHRSLMNATLATVIAFSGLAFPGAIQKAEAAPLTTNINICKRVTVPPKDPWYRCVNLLTDPSWSQHHPGCYSTYKIVCS